MKKLHLSLALAAAVVALSVVATPASAATPGRISGTVTDSLTHSPIEGAYVCAYEASTRVERSCGSTSSNGEYTITDLQPGSYKVEFEAYASGGPYETQWYNGKPSFEAADSVTVEEGETTSGINAALRGEGQISGTVVDATSGAPISGIEVCVESAAANEYYGYGYDCTMTGAGGQYVTEGLSAGAYRVKFESPEKFNEAREVWELEGPNYVAQYYSGQARPEAAAPVNVTNGTMTSGINVAMQPGAAINGTVTDALTNAPLQGVDVCAWGATNYFCAETDTAGNYSIVTVPTGLYKVEFSPERFFSKAYKEHKRAWQRSELPLVEYAVRYWNEKSSFEAAEAVTATAGVATPGINAKLVKQIQPPPPPPAPGIGIVGAKAKVKGGKALLQVKCKGAGACKGKVKLAAKVTTVTKVKGKKPKTHSHVATIGKGSFSIPAGKAKVIPVKLNGAGRLLVTQAGSKGLKAKVSGQGVKSGSVTLKGTAKPKPKKKAPKPKRTHKG